MNNSEVWNNLIELKDTFIEVFKTYGEEYYEDGLGRFNHNSGLWINRTWQSPSFRRAHLDVVDARKEKGLWMMHVCVFPHLGSKAPIYGFDVIAGKNKMTGAFLDFSPTVDPDNQLITDFAELTSDLKWKRERELPEWAQKIFTEHMVAAGNVREMDEILQVKKVAIKTLVHYVARVGEYNNQANIAPTALAQNRYAKYQKQNPHTPRVMKSLGLDENDVDLFIKECLFPEIRY